MKIAKISGRLFIAAVIFFSCKKAVTNTTNVLSDADNIFIKQARIINFSQTEAAKKAILKSVDTLVLPFAQQLLMEHANAQSDLQIMGTIVGFVATDTIDAAHTAMLNQLDTLTGITFDTTYISMQLIEHQTAINFYAAEVKNGNQLNVRAYANSNLQNIEIDYQNAIGIDTTIR